MNSHAYHNFQTNNNSLISLLPIQKKTNYYSLFENICIFISLLGPLFLLVYLTMSYHIYIHFNSIKDSDTISLFSLLYRTDLILLSKILFTGSLFSGIGVILAGIHENLVLFFFCLICFLLSVGFYIPTLIMYTGG
jgi:hypothetical protein